MTNETKFTPGPWHVRDSMRELDGDPTAFPIDASQTCCVADVWADDEQAEANARLIAAAPEMFDALQTVSNLQRLHYGNATLLHLAMIDAAKEIDAALAKAVQP